mmetsp:Transcript_28366/g.71187  ORF Transcript_28366/g.71187 Transcript_28366/m.71187 type:complete len:136 (+) Transcript_28366:104-511(+)
MVRGNVVRSTAYHLIRNGARPPTPWSSALDETPPIFTPFDRTLRPPAIHFPSDDVAPVAAELAMTGAAAAKAAAAGEAMPAAALTPEEAAAAKGALDAARARASVGLEEGIFALSVKDAAKEKALLRRLRRADQG